MSSVPDVTTALEHPAAALRAAVEAENADAFVACLAPTAVLHSPISNRIDFVGPEQIGAVLREVYAIVDAVRVIEVVDEAPRLALHLEGRAGGERFEEAMHARFDPEGRVVELTLFVRPMPALLVFAAALAPRLAPTAPRRVALRAMFGPLASLARRGEPAGVRLTGAGTPAQRR